MYARSESAYPRQQVNAGYKVVRIMKGGVRLGLTGMC